LQNQSVVESADRGVFREISRLNYFTRGRKRFFLLFHLILDAQKTFAKVPQNERGGGQREGKTERCMGVWDGVRDAF